MGLDLDQVRDELFSAFPPDVCLSLARNSEPMVMAPLFVKGIVPQTESLLGFGADLAMCHGWRDKKALVGALRSREFTSGRFEVAVWAALRRAGMLVDYERPSGSPAGKVADFFFLDGAVPVSLEAKRLPLSRADQNRTEIQQVVRDVAMQAGADGTKLSFTIEQEFVDASVAEEPDRFEARLADAARRALDWARGFDHDLAPGHHEVANLGTVDVEPDGRVGMTWTIQNIEEDSGEVSTKRALRLVLQASDQVHEQRDAKVRAVVVHASPWRVPVSKAGDYAQAILRDAREHDLARYRRLDAVVLVNAGPWHVTDTLLLTFPWSRRGVEQMGWVRTLAKLKVG